jgi:hypothetical protein
VRIVFIVYRIDRFGSNMEEPKTQPKGSPQAQADIGPRAQIAALTPSSDYRKMTPS